MDPALNKYLKAADMAYDIGEIHALTPDCTHHDTLDPQRQAGGHKLKRLLCQGDIAPPLGRRGKPIYLGEQFAQSLNVLFHISLLL